jgi:hypothetical protein
MSGPHELELTAVRPARAAAGGRRVYRCTFTPAATAGDRTPVVIDLEPPALRNWDSLHRAALTALGPFFTIRPALPGKLKMDHGDPALRGLLPHQAWQGGGAPGAPRPAPSATAKAQQDADLSQRSSVWTPGPPPPVSGSAEFTAERRRALLGASHLGRAALARADFAAGDDDCEWITIGAQESESGDGRKVGGSPVCIRAGRIIKGHPGLAGRKIDALKEEPAPLGPRQQARRDQEYQRAAYAKTARREGIHPGDLHQLAAEMLAHDAAFKQERTRMLQDARRHARALGSDLQTLRARAARGVDSDAVRGLDDVAESMAASYPEHFQGHASHEERLFDLLAAGNPQPMPESQAYEEALEHLREHAPRREPGGRRRRQEVSDDVPFGRPTP